ncbi:hypothetical protein EYF80_053986 [Liparis tanakae]|uniref:Uncharacterized protein n=1 Tax=Liparis tanakae TaxID=230148 RepID=A0A4Z2F533_9TELE|nr:hypothetical protein EYF80_053986 [Liparis tanakae]
MRSGERGEEEGDETVSERERETAVEGASRRPFTCRLPPTSTLYRGIFTGLMGKESLYHTMSGWGTPADTCTYAPALTEGTLLLRSMASHS